MEKLITGITRFRASSYPKREKLFAELAYGQSPEVLFLTSSDSRIDPNLVTQSDPGDLIIIRNAGNIVPPHHIRSACGVTASIEFAVSMLGVDHIVICGHSDCTAMKGALNPALLSDLPHMQDWLEHSRGAVEAVRARVGDGPHALAAVTEENVILQLHNLRTHPCVMARMATGDLELHGWVYDIEHGTIKAYDETSNSFVPFEERYKHFLKAITA